MGSPVADDLELTLPECDLPSPFVRHPDVAFAIIEKQKPVVLGVIFSPGFLRQAKEINENLVAPPTCAHWRTIPGSRRSTSLQKVFGLPIFDVEVLDDGIIG